MTTLYVRENSGFREAESYLVIQQAHALIARRFRVGSPVLTQPAKTRDFLKLHLGSLDYEVFGVLHLDARMRLIAIEDLFRGTIDSASVHPREVVKSALRHDALHVVAFHNHPSGTPFPSPADEFITARLKDALALVDIRLLDHLIIGSDIYSFAESGRL
jgi:DNA repair protein RadC